ncbi:hypothetical protein Lser_V15G28870 [Lactuca serriola]
MVFWKIQRRLGKLVETCLGEVGQAVDVLRHEVGVENLFMDVFRLQV